MIEFLKDWVLNIITLVMFIVLIEIIVPTGKIKKFINLISGFILIIAIITPFLNLFTDGIDIREFEISTRNFINKKEIEKKSYILQEKQLKQISGLYRKKIINQLEESAKQVEGVIDAKGDVIINEDYSSNHFGEIKRAYLKIKLDQEEQDAGSAVKIEKIKIGVDGDGKAEKDKSMERIREEGKESEVIDRVEEKISKLLNIQKENVVVSIQ